MKSADDFEYQIGSDNIYKDLGFQNPGAWSIKARIAARIFELMDKKELTQKKAGELFGITQGRVSDLKRGQFDKFSVEKLLSFLNALDQDVEIRIHPKVAEAAQVYVVDKST